jgi:hypothetical protein
MDQQDFMSNICRSDFLPWVTDNSNEAMNRSLAFANIPTAEIPDDDDKKPSKSQSLA